MVKLFGLQLGSGPAREPDWRVADPSDEEPYSEIFVPLPPEAELAKIRARLPLAVGVELTDEEPFSIVEVREPTAEERLAHYALYRHLGGGPYEPTESLFRESESAE
jgi:hypothetical protein